MRKINKSKILSKGYELWLKSLEGDHPKYYSSHKYIKDIKMNLLFCQKGLCAYTEELLCDPELIKTENWNEDRYITDLSTGNLINGDVEHFDCTLKDNKAYLWDNLFMVNSNINCRVKKTKPIKKILKPDSKDYDEYRYLQFDHTLNRFIPNNNLSQNEKTDILEMIETLGINSNAFKRAKQIKSLKEDFLLDLDLNEPIEYITSWKMTLLDLQAKKEWK